METSSIKNQAREIIDKMPDNSTWEDLMHEIYVRQAIEAGMADSQAGQTVDVNQIRREFGLPRGDSWCAANPLEPIRRVEMRFFSFEIVIEKEPEDEGYLAYSPTLPGCFSNGCTIEDAKRNIREAIEQHLASLLDHGQNVPQNERLVHVEELTVGIPE